MPAPMIRTLGGDMMTADVLDGVNSACRAHEMLGGVSLVCYLGWELWWDSIYPSL